MTSTTIEPPVLPDADAREDMARYTAIVQEGLFHTVETFQVKARQVEDVEHVFRLAKKLIVIHGWTLLERGKATPATLEYTHESEPVLRFAEGRKK